MKRYSNIYRNHRYFEVRDTYTTRAHVYRVAAAPHLKYEYSTIRTAAALYKFMARLRRIARNGHGDPRAPYTAHYVEC